jgi:putative ABC transport system substrate-binding protein
MSALAKQFSAGWVEPLRDPTLGCRVGDVGSREELDPTYGRVDAVISRRDLITLIGGAATASVVAWPLAARAQQRALPVVGFLHVGSAGPFAHLVAGFRQGLKETGFVEGQNVAVEFRWADGQYDRLPALAADLARRQVAVILTGGGEPSIFAVRAASATVPIVFNIGSDPVRLGIVASLGRPGGSATGVNILSVELAAKRLGLLNDLMPKDAVFAFLVNPNFPPTETNIEQVEAAGRSIGRRFLLLKASSENEIDAAFTTIAQMRAGALLVGTDPFFTGRRAQIVVSAARLGIPAMYEQREFASAGGLISYGTSLADSYRQQGVYVGRILKGEKAGDLPVIQPTKFELVINLKTAQALGLEIPDKMLALADEVIE